MPGLLAAAIPAIAGGVMGMVSQGWGRQQQLQQSANLIKQQTKAGKELGQFSHDLQYDMWQKTNYKPQVEQMQKAGLNPALMYGMSGGGGVTTGSGSVPLPSIPSAEGPSGTAQVIAKGMDMAMMMSQKRLMDAQASKAEAEAAKTAGIDTKVGEAQEESLLQGVDNARQQHQLQKLQITLDNMKNFEQQASQSDRLEYIMYQTRKAARELELVENEAFISDATMKSKIDIVKSQAIQAVLHNALTKAQTDKTKSDIQVNRDVMRKITNDIMINWDRLGVDERAQSLKELQQQFKMGDEEIEMVQKSLKQIFNILK